MTEIYGGYPGGGWEVEGGRKGEGAGGSSLPTKKRRSCGATTFWLKMVTAKQRQGNTGQLFGLMDLGGKWGGGSSKSTPGLKPWSWPGHALEALAVSNRVPRSVGQIVALPSTKARQLFKYVTKPFVGLATAPLTQQQNTWVHVVHIVRPTTGDNCWGCTRACTNGIK